MSSSDSRIEYQLISAGEEICQVWGENGLESRECSVQYVFADSDEISAIFQLKESGGEM